ncbi:hypothetical protein QFZ94_002053 [Paraburkholderia sp. JPY465]|uniref:hypothetical protein n=1 Tax=Paraburkholderia sp. JPY465 TaxID=3042285 RepID=UPI003D1EA759
MKIYLTVSNDFTGPQSSAPALQIIDDRVQLELSGTALLRFRSNASMLGRCKMQELSDRGNVTNPLITGISAYEGSLEKLYVPRAQSDTSTDRVLGSLKADSRLPVFRVVGRSGIGKSGSRRHACVDCSGEEVGAPHQLGAADTPDKMDHDRNSVRVEHLGHYVEPETDFQAYLKKFWIAPERSRKHVLVDHFRLPQGGYLPMGVLSDLFANWQRGKTAHATGNAALALCRQWADLGRYGALQAHFDACDGQLR